MTPHPDGPANGNPPPIPSEDLIAGLQLLRAANLQAVRLQLAMFRQERRTAMESLDRLADMDRELERFLAGLEPAAPALDAINRLVATQKNALADEKIALMAEIRGPKVAPKADAARPLPCPADAPPGLAIAPPDPPVEMKAPPPRIIIASEEGPVVETAREAGETGRRWGRLVALTLLAILIMAGGAAGWLVFTQPERAAALWREGGFAVSELLSRLPLP